MEGGLTEHNKNTIIHGPDITGNTPQNASFKRKFCLFFKFGDV